MTYPAYVLDVRRFDALMRKAGYVTQSEFLLATGMPRRTLSDALDHRSGLTGRTIRYFLDAFPGTSFEYLFYAPDRPRLVADRRAS